MKNLIIILAIILVPIFVFGDEVKDRVCKATTEDYTVESIGEVKVDVTVPVTQSVTLNGIEYAISLYLMQIEAYEKAITETTKQMDSLKALREEVKVEAEKVIIKKGDGV